MPRGHLSMAGGGCSSVRGWANRDRTGVAQRVLAVVSTTTVSLSASRECRSGGMTSRSPLRPSQLVLPALSNTCPLSTMIVASPGLLCSVSDDPSRRAITVWRRTCSCPPKTVDELRPLDSSFARASCSRPMASKDSFFTVFTFRLTAPFCGWGACGSCLIHGTGHAARGGQRRTPSRSGSTGGSAGSRWPPPEPTSACPFSVLACDHPSSYLAPAHHQWRPVALRSPSQLTSRCHSCLLYTSPSPRDGL